MGRWRGQQGWMGLSTPGHKSCTYINKQKKIVPWVFTMVHDHPCCLMILLFPGRLFWSVPACIDADNPWLLLGSLVTRENPIQGPAQQTIFARHSVLKGKRI